MLDMTTTEAFLEEACEWRLCVKVAGKLLFSLDVMQKFHHPHIIRLIGVCIEQPVLLIIELARLGEVRCARHLHFLSMWGPFLATGLSTCQSHRFRSGHIGLLLRTTGFGTGLSGIEEIRSSVRENLLCRSWHSSRLS